jgi:NADP-dependent 3-hydroxy acid dehydrogenase YdfG
MNNANTTTEDVLRGVDLSGKLAVVTGASGGLGLETARAPIRGRVSRGT